MDGELFFTDGSNLRIPPISVVMPLVAYKKYPGARLLGTCSMIGKNGLILTAGHIPMGLLQDEKISPAIDLNPGSHKFKNEILALWADGTRTRKISMPLVHSKWNSETDLSIGFLADYGEFINKNAATAVLHFIPPQIGERVAMYGYLSSGHMDVDGDAEKKLLMTDHIPSFESGIVTDVQIGRDEGQLHPYPGFRVNFKIKGGNSGSPIFNSRGHIIGIATASWEGEDDGFVSLLWPMVAMSCTIIREGKPEEVSVYDMITRDKLIDVTSSIERIKYDPSNPSRIMLNI